MINTKWGYKYICFIFN